MGKLPGPTNEIEQSLVIETGEFERPKFDCISIWCQIMCGKQMVISCIMMHNWFKILKTKKAEKDVSYHFAGAI